MRAHHRFSRGGQVKEVIAFCFYPRYFSFMRRILVYTMWKLFVWPMLLLVFREYNRYYFFHHPLGMFDMLGATLLELYIIVVLITYIPLISLYEINRRFRHKGINLAICLVIGLASVLIGLVLLFTWPPVQHLSDLILRSNFWWQLSVVPKKFY